jgi:hypothetical protein
LYTKTTKEVAEYVGRTFKYGGDMRLAVERLEAQAFTPPVDPDEDATQTEREIWKEKIKEFVKQGTIFEENKKTLYSLVWGQCTDIMRQKVEALDDFEAMANAGDGLGLLRAIKNLCFNLHHSQKYVGHAIHESKRRFYQCTQGKHMTTQAYLEAFRNTIDVIEHTGGSIGHEPGLNEYVATRNNIDYDHMDAAEEEDVQNESHERYLAVAFILGADKLRYGRLLESLENNFLQGQNRYPATVTAAYGLLTNWKQDPRNYVRAIGRVNDGVSFTNVDGGDAKDGDVTLATDGQGKKGGNNSKKKDKLHITCRRCGEKGHYSDKCDGERKTSGATMLMDGVEQGKFDEDEHFQFLQHDTGTTLQIGNDGRVPKTWILLDNQSTVDVFSNASLLKNVCVSNASMDIHCNAGVTSTKMVGDLPG